MNILDSEFDVNFSNLVISDNSDERIANSVSFAFVVNKASTIIDTENGYQSFIEHALILGEDVLEFDDVEFNRSIIELKTLETYKEAIQKASTKYVIINNSNLTKSEMIMLNRLTDKVLFFSHSSVVEIDAELKENFKCFTLK